MRPLLQPLKRILLQLLLLLCIYFLCRCGFVLFVRSRFEDLEFSQFIRLCGVASRYDISAILSINALYVLLLLLPFPIWKMKAWEEVTKWVFLVPNIIALILEVGDWAYFPYNFKRSTADLFKVMGRKGDFLILLPGFVADYWYMFIILALLLVFLVVMNNKIYKATPLDSAPQFSAKTTTVFMQAIFMVIAAGIALIGIRGSLRHTTIDMKSAQQITDSKYFGIVINTPFSILSTFDNTGLEESDYYNPQELRTLINPVKEYQHKSAQRKNVVLIIVESLSKEFTCLGGRKSYTPFLDSLMGQSLVCTQAYANALHSAEGVPSVICGIPSLMEEPFISSQYRTNKYNGLPGLLRQEGYETAFFHGATNGSMDFDIFSKLAGYQHYYGRTEYNDETEYDGNWGIRDEPFLQFFANNTGKLKTPFCSTVFTLSSHPPYKLPEKYLSTLPKGDMPIYQCIAYTDMSVRRFFENARRQPWYDSTLFVISADHCSPKAGDSYHRHNLGQYAIPVIFYCPSDTSLRGVYTQPVQQLDIMPSILDYLGYSKPFYTLGNSIFNPHAERFVINEISNAYQWLQNGYLLKLTDTIPKAMYKFPEDSACVHNILPQHLAMARRQMIPRYKAFLQEYRSAVIHNKMTAQAN